MSFTAQCSVHCFVKFVRGLGALLLFFWCAHSLILCLLRRGMVGVGGHVRDWQAVLWQSLREVRQGIHALVYLA